MLRIIIMTIITTTMVDKKDIMIKIESIIKIQIMNMTIAIENIIRSTINMMIKK